MLENLIAQTLQNIKDKNFADIERDRERRRNADAHIHDLQDHYGVSREEAIKMHYAGKRIGESEDILKQKVPSPSKASTGLERKLAAIDLKNEIKDRMNKHNPKTKKNIIQKVLGKLVGEDKIAQKTLKSLKEVYHRSPKHAGRSISQKFGTIRDDSDKDPEYHKGEIKAIGDAIKANPEWASSMLPQMQSRLEHHQKRLAALTPVKEEYSESNPKIDLYHRSGKYLASTNFSPTVKHAVSRYEEKYPQHKGMVKGEIAKK
jgi:hypothetical protein